jgi:hypothetical protein
LNFCSKIDKRPIYGTFKLFLPQKETYSSKNQKKANMVTKRQLLGALVFSSLLFFNHNVVYAQPKERFVIRTLIVEPFSGNLDKKDEAAIRTAMEEALNQTFFFTVLSPKNSARKLDGLITGSLNRSGDDLMISLLLQDAGSNQPVATESVKVDGRDTVSIQEGLKKLSWALVNRLPSKGEVVQIHRGRITIDSGGLQGVRKRGTLSIFRIKGVTRHPFTHEIIEYQKTPVASAVVTDLQTDSAQAKIVRSFLPIQKGDLVTYEISEKTAAAYRARRPENNKTTSPAISPLQAPVVEKGSGKNKEKSLSRNPGRPSSLEDPSIEGRRGWARVSFVYLESRYSFDSDTLRFKRKVDFFPGIQADLGYWIWRHLGVAAFYQVSWIRFNDQSGNAYANASPSWIVPQIIARPPTIGPISVKAALGYSIYSFSYIHGDRTFLVDSRVSGPLIQLEVSGKFYNRFLGRLTGSFEPFQSVSEDPVTSGTDGTATGYRLEASGGWLATKNLVLEIGYQFQRYKYDFSGAGSRNGGVTNAGASEQYSGPLVSLRLIF